MNRTTVALALLAVGVLFGAGALLSESGSGGDRHELAPDQEEPRMVSEADAELAVPSAPHTANGQNDASDRSDARLPVDPHDHEALKKELESVYAGAEVADLKHAMGLARYEYETLRQQAMSEQVAMGKYNRAAQIDAGFTPKEILDQRPKVRYSHQVSLNPGSMEPPEEGIWVVEYYVREDEYPDVYRAFDEWNWLKRQIKKLEGETR